MRFYEYKQSTTSPLKYNLELSTEELEKVKELIMKIIQITKQKELDDE
tara:strand:- start:10138 stop:10281 length:144 start_codon:yes stop_codon:yes gene_type:complete